MKIPTCEMCGKEQAHALSWFRDSGWKLTGQCSLGKEAYYIELRGLSDKSAPRAEPWFDAEDFQAALDRLKE